MSGQIVQQGQINTNALVVPNLIIQIVPPSFTILNGVPTNIVGIVGTANWGPVNSPTIASGVQDATRQFGAMQPRKFDLGTAVYAAALQGGVASLRLVRVTDGTDVAASATLGTGIGITLTGIYTGSNGNNLSAVLSAGSNSTAGAPTFKLTVALPGQLPETFDNIGGTGNTIYQNMASAINNGQSGLRGPSQLLVATAGSGTVAPTVPTTLTFTGGTDGATTITSSTLVGLDTIPRKGMYALRNTGASVAMLADADDSTQWTLQSAFGLSEGIYMVGVSPAGDTISTFTTTIATAGIDSYAMKIIFGDWCFIFDPVNNQQRLISPQGFMAGLLGNMTPSNSTLNKPIQGIIGTQKTQLNQQYSQAELQALALARCDLITNPAPGGNYFAARFGRNTSSNAVIHGDNYTRMTNFIAATLNAGMGIYVGKKISPTLMNQAYATLDTFLFNLEQQGESAAHQVILDKSNNPFSRTALGYLQADIKVQYQSILEVFLVNLEGGQSVQIKRVSTAPQQ